jgi:hypothetical protein
MEAVEGRPSFDPAGVLDRDGAGCKGEPGFFAGAAEIGRSQTKLRALRYLGQKPGSGYGLRLHPQAEPASFCLIIRQPLPPLYHIMSVNYQKKILEFE